MEQLKAVIFDLDGVIVRTDAYHYHGWQRLCDKLDLMKRGANHDE